MQNQTTARFGAIICSLLIFLLSGRALADFVDEAGNIYTVGTFGRTVDFNPGAGVYNLTAAGASDIFVSKLDKNGNFLWARRFGSGREDFADHAVLRDGIVVQGYSVSPATNQREIIIGKLNARGQFAWIRRFVWVSDDLGRPGPAEVSAMVVDNVGAIITAGFVESATDFRPGDGSFVINACCDVPTIFISKLDANGQFVWADSIDGSEEFNAAQELSFDSSNNTYLTASIRYGLLGTTLFDGVDVFPDCPDRHCSTSDVFLLKFTPGGSLAWHRQIGGRANDAAIGFR